MNSPDSDSIADKIFNQFNNFFKQFNDLFKSAPIELSAKEKRKQEYLKTHAKQIEKEVDELIAKETGMDRVRRTFSYE